MNCIVPVFTVMVLSNSQIWWQEHVSQANICVAFGDSKSDGKNNSVCSSCVCFVHNNLVLYDAHS